ncbi:TPA: RNA chaperone Hfq [Candidatus Sumerlaeota bacterium]|jgi:host factor-I protein|nr:RNA chaperone Hfq [Candidatus Sumerlaeota bacterium]
MSNYSVNLQDSFLNQVRKDGVEVEMVLSSGLSFTGHVRGFDNFTVVMQVGGAQHLVYKHAIAQIVSQRPLRPHVHEEKCAICEEAVEEAPVVPEKPKHAKPERQRRPGKGGHADDAKAQFNGLDLSHIKLGAAEAQ